MTSTPNTSLFDRRTQERNAVCFYDDSERDEDDEDDEVDYREDWPYCSCGFCFCHVQTEYGEVCSDCLGHAHQG